MPRRPRITEQDDRYTENYDKAKKDPANIQALTILYLEDLGDRHDELVDKVVLHCALPVDRAHAPCAEAKAQAGPGDGLTPAQRYKIAVMENRGKILAGAFGVCLAILAIVFKSGGV